MNAPLSKNRPQDPTLWPEAGADPHDYPPPSFAEPGHSLSNTLADCHFVACFLLYADRSEEECKEFDKEGYIYHGRRAIIRGLGNTLSAAADLVELLEQDYEKLSQTQEEVKQ